MQYDILCNLNFIKNCILVKSLKIIKFHLNQVSKYFPYRNDGDLLLCFCRSYLNE